MPSCIYPVFFTFALFIGQLTLKQLSKLIFFYFVFNATLAAQSTVFILKAESSIAVDGNITHAEWDRFEPITDFTQNFPFDTGKAQIKTEVKFCYDDEMFYISARCFQPREYTVQSLKYDFDNGSTDIFALILDPSGDHQNGFFFGVNPYGVLKEGQIFISNELNISWNNKWIAKVQRSDTSWDMEMAIPFKSIRYNQSQDTWYVNFLRNDVTHNERSSWCPVPRLHRMSNVRFTRPIVWKELPPKPGKNSILIPYVLNESNKDHLSSTKINKPNIGIDAKVGITPSLNLDLTLNPDFAQVEVDRQVTNLSRFELLFPEQRQFFVENNDLFGSMGSVSISPFFSRRIGLAPDPKTGINKKVPILGGMRLSGKLNDNTRIGFMNMQTDCNKTDSLPTINFSVASFQKKIWKRSNLNFLFVNKHSFLNENSLKSLSAFNRVAGAEFNYLSKNGLINGKVFGIQSWTANQTKNGSSFGAVFEMNTRHTALEANLYHVGSTFNAEVGYVPRTGFLRFPATYSYRFYPKKNWGRWINSIELGPDYDFFYGYNDKRVTDWDAGMYYKVLFSDGSSINGSFMRWDYTYLFSDFDPTNKYTPGFKILKKGEQYRYFNNRISFLTSSRYKLVVTVQGRFGQYFNGDIFSLTSNLSYRIQPYSVLSFNVNYNRLRFPAGYNNADFWVVGPRSEFTFTKNLFWTSFFQYNNQVNNFNINSRLQWRFKPLSDLFIVYTSNYFAQPENVNQYERFDIKNKALVVKLNYWLNM